MELEFRNKAGEFLFTIHGEAAERTFNHLLRMPELHKTTKKLGKNEELPKDYVVFLCTKLCGYTFFGTLDFVLKVDDYIKVIN
jgi:hypothetical protein